MTIAWHGKSKRRRGALALAAALSTVVAFLVGLGQFDGEANAETSDFRTGVGSYFSGTCENPADAVLYTTSKLATCDPGETVVGGGFNLQATGIPSTATAIGFVVQTTAFVASPNGIDYFSVALSWDGGASFTTSDVRTADVNTAARAGDRFHTGECNSFGRTWTYDELSDTSFRVRATAFPNVGDQLYLKELAVQLCWTAPTTGALHVTKKVSPTGAAGSDEFELCITGPAPSEKQDCQQVPENDTARWDDLAPGVYTVTEPSSPYWFAGGSGVPVEVVAGQTKTHEIVNILRQRLLTVCKVLEDNHDGVPQGGAFTFTLGWPANPGDPAPYPVRAQFSIEVTEGSQDCTDVDIPTVQPVQVVELPARPANWAQGDAPGHPTFETSGSDPATGDGNASPLLGPGNTLLTFYNKAAPATGNIVVKKVVTNVENDDTHFLVSLSHEVTDPGDALLRENLPQGVTFEHLLPGQYTLAETPATNYISLGWAFADEAGACPDWPNTLGDAPLHVSVSAGATTTVCLYNKAVGSLTIRKVDQTGRGPWQFEVTGPEGIRLVELPGGNADPGDAITIDTLPLGAYTVREVNGSTLETCPVPNEEPGAFLTTMTEGEGDLAIDEPGENIVVEFLNRPCDIVLGTGHLVVEKVEDLDGDGVRDPSEDLLEWTVNVTGPALPGGEAVLLTGGTRTFPAIDDGTYRIVEHAAPGYRTVGVRVNDGELTAAGEANVTVTNGQTTTVTFYNQPLFAIEVRKTEPSSQGSAPGEDWTFTLSGCDLEPIEKTTGPDGRALFENLPLPHGGCAYHVSETQHEDWTAADSAERSVSSANAGDTIALHFTNIRVEPQTPTGTPTSTPTQPSASPTTPASPTSPIRTPTLPAATATPIEPTPTAPTSTPTLPAPTATPIEPKPTATPIEPVPTVSTSTATPDLTATTEPQVPVSPSPDATPVDTVAGDRTPGAPNAGTGAAVPGGSSNRLVIGALLSLSLLAPLLALRRRTS